MATDQVFEISSTRQFKSSSHQTAENLHIVLQQNTKRYENDEELYKFLPSLHYSLQDWSAEDQKWFLDQLFVMDTSPLKLKLLLQFIKSLSSGTTKTLNFTPLLEIVQSTEDDEILSLGLICLKETSQLPALIKRVLPKLKMHPKLVSFALAQSIENCVVFRSENFWSQMPSLLQPSESRKYAIYIIEVILEHFATHPDLTIQIPKYLSINTDNRNKIFKAWSNYLTILKNLDEKQSHLILPSLENLHEVRSLPKLWSELLLRQLLKHNNNLVIRWTVKHIFENFTGNDLSVDLYNDFMTSLNNIFLYSAYSSQLDMVGFLSGNISLFLKSFESVDWKGVPMSYCFRTLIKIKMERTVPFPKELPIEILLSIAKNVRKVQHRTIRNVLRVFIIILFSNEYLADLNLQDFAYFIEALYNKNELVATFYSSHFVEKLRSKPDFDISETVYSLISRRLPNFISNSDDLQYFAEKEFSKGFLRIAEERKVDLQLQKMSLEEVLENFEGVLNLCSVDVIVNLLSASETKIPENLLELVLKKVGEMVGKFGSDAPYDCVANILRYCRKHFPESLLQHAKNLLYTDLKNPFLAQEVFSLTLNDELIFKNSKEDALEFLLSGLTYGDFQSGNDKIEFDYILEELKKDVNSPWKNYTCFPSQVRAVCLNALSSNIKSKEVLKELKEHLLQKSIEISTKKPRYFKNSPHHRLKLRVICALAVLHRNKCNRIWDDRLLKTVFEENNQNDVTMIAERIVAMTISKEVLLNLVAKLPSMTPSTQVSLFSICFMFCRINDDNVLAQQFVQTFLPYTMGQNFITRLNAQITIYHLVTLFDISEYAIIKTAILESFKTQSNQEVNFMKLNESIQHTIWSNEGCIDDECLFALMYSTDSPVDEFYFGLAVQMYSFDPNGSKFCQRMIASDDSTYDSRKKIYAPALPPEEQKLDEFAITSNVQRKANPIQVSTDFKVFHEDIEETEAEMIVVASLIDKIPNLGGIARTCEVLGIENLVISSLKFSEGTEFKNVSMTAEKYLNLSEMKPKFLQTYLIEKKSQGYSIVGAEQTSNSVNFIGFKFPKKCVLVLGHEKEGIPANLLGLLDYAVEIPQTGIIRSLNVHVTGALFMWKYSKQHIVEKGC